MRSPSLKQTAGGGESETTSESSSGDAKERTSGGAKGGKAKPFPKIVEGRTKPNSRRIPRRIEQLDSRFEVRTLRGRPRHRRGIFAVQDVPAGTQVMVAQQTAGVPKDAYRAAFCRRCLTLLDKSTLIKCRRCEDRFCGKECVIAAAGEGTHEATCAFMENIGGGGLPTPVGDSTLPPAYPPAATETELLRLTMECLARRRAGLCSDEEWEEIMELEPCDVGKSRVQSGKGAGVGSQPVEALGNEKIFHPTVFREASEKLKYGARDVTVEEMEKVHCRLRKNFHLLQPEPLGRLLPPTVLVVFPAAGLVNHSCEPNACFHARRAGPGGPPVEYVLRCTAGVAAGEEVCISYLAHFASSTREGRRELLEKVWGFTCDCPACMADTPAGSSAGDWRVTKMLQDMEALLENAQSKSVREAQAELRCHMEQGLQLLLAGPDISPRMSFRLALRIDEIAIRRRMHGSLRFRSAQELAERLVRAGLDNGYTADLRFTMHREALQWAQDARLEGSHCRWEQMKRASRDSLEEAIKVAAVSFGEGHPKTLALMECLRRFTLLHSV